MPEKWRHKKDHSIVYEGFKIDDSTYEIENVGRIDAVFWEANYEKIEDNDDDSGTN